MAQRKYVHQSWPSWRFGPNGESQIFQSEDEVPEGWQDSPAKLKGIPQKPEVVARGDGTDAPSVEAKIDTLMQGNTQGGLVKMLEAMKELDDTLEFAPNWPKVRLATLIVNNGGPLEE